MRVGGLRRAVPADAVVVVLAAAAFAAAALAGHVLSARGVPVHASAAPIFGRWQPRVGGGTVPALLIAVLVTRWGPRCAQRLSWRALLLVTAVAAAAWTLALALVDGPDGVAGPLSTPSEYLTDIPRVTSVRELLGHWTDSVSQTAPDPWATHVAGHPPGALLVFTGLARLGLGSGGAGLVCVLAGAAGLLAVAVAVRDLAGEGAARRLAPYLVLFPASVWVGVSADAVFMAVSAWGTALLALAAARVGARSLVLALAGGLLLGAALFLSYGLVLAGPIAFAAVLAGAGSAGAARRAVLVLVVAGLAVASVVGAVGLGGLWWWDGYRAVLVRYRQGYGGTRPYGYWSWADLTVLLVVVGPAGLAGVRRCLRGPGSAAVRVLVTSASLVVTAAAVTGLSKGEVERIWLPFTLWLLVACAALPQRRAPWWLGAQALTALAVEHLLLLPW